VIPAEGGAPVPVPSVGSRRPYVLPDGSGLLSSRAGGIQFHDFASDSTWVIIADGAHPTYVESGHILYVPASGGLFVVPFDLDGRQVTGPPQRVLNRVASGIGWRGYAVARNGTLVHHEGDAGLGSGGGARRRLLIVDGQEVADTVRHPAGAVDEPRFSPDGRTIAYDFGPLGVNESNIYTYDLLTGTNPQITFEGDNDSPVWSPDGKRILFRSERDGADADDLYVKPADNSSGAEPVLSRPRDQRPSHWLEDDVIVFGSTEAGTQDIWTYSVSGGGDPEAYLEAPWQESGATVSPDGALAAYESNETGTVEVWLNDFPVPAGKRRVTFGGARAPRWSPDGNTLYYWKDGAVDDSLFSVAIERDPAVAVRQPELVLAMNFGSNFGNWDVHPDGERFLVTVEDESGAATAGGEPSQTRFLVVLNWFEELKARVGN
jgi:Tol biopolymer transport system component